MEFQSPAHRRHSRVKSWTKNVDIFSKDFVVFPINEKAHWFLVGICFPGLEGPVDFETGQLLPNTSKTKVVSKDTKKKPPIVEDLDSSDKDEAEGDEDEMIDEDDEEPLPKKTKLLPIKQ